MIEALIGVVQSVYTFVLTNLGLKADVADSTGTVLARLKHIIDSAIPGVNTNISTLSGKLFSSTLANFKLGSATIKAITYATAHSYTGSGILRRVSQGVMIETGTAAKYTSSLKITIDGTVIFDGIASIAHGLGSTSFYSSSTSMDILSSPIVFNTSLLIEHKTSAVAAEALTTWNYTI